MDYLTTQDVEDLHQYALVKWGGLPGREKGKLEGALSIPMSGFSTFERYPTIYEKAAAYYYYLASGHCFNDGNKRTSYLATMVFLDINGYDLIVPDDEAYNFTMSIAENTEESPRTPFEDVVDWVKYHVYER